MSGRTAQVWLGEVRAGDLREDDRGSIEFRVDRRFRDLPGRPVLGQYFEDHDLQRGEPVGHLPPFFANLIPEGDLGLILRERLGVADGDDLGLLLAVGEDLPGAVIVRSDGGGHGASPLERAPGGDASVSLEPRFSLAGVQLKFSMARNADRFTFPGRDGRGDWIAKIALENYVWLPQNEFVTMEWARRAGFEVPRCELRKLGELVDVPYNGDPDSVAFMIERYDRAPGRRIHQEDMQQVLGRPPLKKYDDATYDQLALLFIGIMGADVFEEVLRRLVFVVASGNDDAHLKNWSLLYRDAVTASLTPLYDQVFTAFDPRFGTTLALKLGGAKQFVQIDIGRFRELARRAGQDAARAASKVDEIVADVAQAWTRTLAEIDVPEPYRARLRAHWARVPLLADRALLLGT